MSMKDAIQRFLRHLDEDQRGARNTLLAYRTDILQFEKVLAAGTGGQVRPENLTVEMVADYSAWLTQKGFRPSTISRKMAAVRAFLGYLQGQDELRDLPYLEELKAPPTPRAQPRILSPEEIALLLKAPTLAGSPRGLRDAAILQLFYATGLRASEVVVMNVEDLDQFQGRIRRAGRSSGWISLDTAASSIDEYMVNGRPFLARAAHEKALFLNLRGQRLSRQGIWLVVKRWSRAANLGAGISPHSLRHSMIHHWLLKGKTKRDVQQMLGLSSPNAIRMKIDRG